MMTDNDQPDQSLAEWLATLPSPSGLPSESDPEAVARVIRREVLDRPFRVVPPSETDEPRPIRPAGVKPIGGKLVKPESAPLAIGLTLEEMLKRREAGQSLSDLTPERSGERSLDGLPRTEDEPGFEGEAEAPMNEEGENELAPEEEENREPLYRPKKPVYQNDLQFAQDLAMAEPKMVAATVKEWLNPK